MPEMMAAERTVATPEAYAQELVSKYGLNADQKRRLMMVLEEDQRVELNILRDADWSQLPQALRSKRLVAKRKTEQRIRFVLDEKQRALYDRDSRPHGSASDAMPGEKDK